MKRHALILLLALPALAQEPADLQFGTVDAVESKLLGQTRRINVLLPAGYDTSSVRYPTLYLLDGSAHEDYFHVAALVDYMATYGMIPPHVVVGISNLDRRHDFTTPTCNAEDRRNSPTSGGAETFLQFVQQELIPHVEDRYRCDGSRTLVGQSLGGLLATQILLQQPEDFDRFLIVSPSLWWDEFALSEAAPAMLAEEPTRGRSVYVSVGDEHPEMIRVARKLADDLRACPWPGLVVHYDHLPDENHATALHVSAYRGLRALFPHDEE